jgi:hypothetical protein
MTSLIPRLEYLFFTRNNRYRVPPGFAERFVRIHRGSENDDEAWRSAQDHWEQVVGKVFDTDAVAPDANGETAMIQAVIAAAELLNVIAQRGYCPLCVMGRPNR